MCEKNKEDLLEANIQYSIETACPVTDTSVFCYYHYAHGN